MIYMFFITTGLLVGAVAGLVLASAYPSVAEAVRELLNRGGAK